MTPEQRARLAQRAGWVQEETLTPSRIEMMAGENHASGKLPVYDEDGEYIGQAFDIITGLAVIVLHQRVDVGALVQKVADAEARERQSQDNESIYVLSRDYDALAAERDALLAENKQLRARVESDLVMGNRRAEQAEQERDHVIEQLGRVYCHVTGGLLSKAYDFTPNIQSTIDDYQNEFYGREAKASLEEAEEKWEKACEVLESMAQEKAQAERTAAALQRRVTALEAAMNPQDVADVDAALAPTKEEA